MAKIINIFTREILADLPTERTSPRTAMLWDFPDDEHYLQYKIHAIADNFYDAKDILERAELIYNEGIKKVS
jgi:hypothetical protein